MIIDKKDKRGTDTIKIHFPPKTSNGKGTQMPKMASSITRHKRKANGKNLSQ